MENAPGSGRNKTRTVKADLLVFPHFFSQPYHKPPKLKTIVDHISNNTDLGIVALTSCHTQTSGMDYRFLIYMNELGELKADYEVDYNENIGQLNIKRKKDRKEFVLLHAQKVRAYD